MGGKGNKQTSPEIREDREPPDDNREEISDMDTGPQDYS